MLNFPKTPRPLECRILPFRNINRIVNMETINTLIHSKASGGETKSRGGSSCNDIFSFLLRVIQLRNEGRKPQWL